MTKMDTAALKKFGMTMAGALLVIAVLVNARHKTVSWQIPALTGLFLAAGFIHPQALRLAYILWMRFAMVLAWINTRLILTAMFYLVFTPMGLTMRFLGKDTLDRRLEIEKDSYWSIKEEKGFNRADYERRF